MEVDNATENQYENSRQTPPNLKTMTAAETDKINFFFVFLRQV